MFSLSKHTTSLVLIVSSLIITACSSSSGGGGGATVPANAITITNSNAEPTVEDAAKSSSSFDAFLRPSEEGASNPAKNLKQAHQAVSSILKDASKDISLNLPTGTSINVSENCSGGGTLSFSGNLTNNGSTESFSGTAAFNNCVELGNTFNGTVTYSYTENSSTGDYSDSFSGSLSLSGNGISISFTGANYAENGNDFTNTYTISAMTYSLSYSGSGGSGGYLLTLTAPIIESDGDSCPESGHITITGAGGTTAEGIYNGDDTMTIIANGSVVNPSAPCYN